MLKHILATLLVNTYILCNLILLAFILSAQLYAQQGTLQVYCIDGATIYLNGKHLGKTNAGMHGLLGI